MWHHQVGILATLRHPNIVKFMGLCLEPACFITEWCTGGSLAETLQKALTQTDIAAKLSWFRRLVMALEIAKVANHVLFLRFMPHHGLAHAMTGPFTLVGCSWACSAHVTDGMPVLRRNFPTGADLATAVFVLYIATCICACMHVFMIS